MDLASWFGVLILVLALAYIPASVMAATGSWRRALGALKEYSLIMVGFGVFAVLGLLAAIVEHGPEVLWRAFMGR